MIGATPEKVKKFIGWLQAQNAEIMPTTNPYEVVRFRARQGVGVVYRRTNGRHTVSAPWVEDAWNCYREGLKWSGKGKPGKRINGSKAKRAVFDRDGDLCWYCGLPMPRDDMTLEHILSVGQGGPNRMENYALAHEKCNAQASNMAVVEKVRLREALHRGNGVPLIQEGDNEV